MLLVVLLHRWWPATFRRTASCAFDSPPRLGELWSALLAPLLAALEPEPAYKEEIDEGVEPPFFPAILSLKRKCFSTLGFAAGELHQTYFGPEGVHA